MFSSVGEKCSNSPVRCLFSTYLDETLNVNFSSTEERCKSMYMSDSSSSGLREALLGVGAFQTT